MKKWTYQKNKIVMSSEKNTEMEKRKKKIKKILMGNGGQRRVLKAL